VLEGKLCGYILSRVVGRPWGYMLPIQPVIKDICKDLALDATKLLKVFSRTLLNELLESRKMNEIPQELPTVGEESRHPQAEKNLISPQSVTPTATLAGQGYLYNHTTRRSLVILALWICVFITNAVSIWSSL
jgi:hypothetical protein